MAFYSTLAQISNLLAVQPQPPIPVEGISTDTRDLQPGALFVALTGEHRDGHDFATKALEQGAVGAIIRQDRLLHQPGPWLRVPDTLVAYQALAHWWRGQFSLPLVAVTGSAGKTTTKEFIAGVLRGEGYASKVLKTAGNFNNQIGVPRTLLELDRSYEFAVLEMAMRGPGEIALLSQIARPDVGVITNVGTAHIGRLGSEQAIANAKCELLANLPSTGLAVLNYDCPRLIETAKGVWSGRTLTYGLTGGDLSGELLDNQTLRVRGRCLPLPVPGRHQAQNYLAALGVAEVLGIDWAFLERGLTIELPPGRAKRYFLASDLLILDETYNAGLESMVAALELLAATPGRRHLAVLGTMKELGDYAWEFHYRVGVKARDFGLDGLVVLADEPATLAVADGARPLPTRVFTQGTDLVPYLLAATQPGDRWLFKASRSVGLERVVEEFRLAWPGANGEVPGLSHP